MKKGEREKYEKRLVGKTYIQTESGEKLKQNGKRFYEVVREN